MPRHHLLPLLVAGTICLPLAACGSDDEPTASATPQTAPAETAPAAPSDADANGTPADTTEQAPADADPNGSTSSTPPDGASDDKDATGATTTRGADSTPDTEPKSTPKSAKDPESPSGSASSSKDKQPAAPKVPKALEDYAKGGAPATADEAKSVRDTMLGFQEALTAQDADKACSYTLGLPAKADPSKPTPSCEALIEGSKASPPTDQDREMIRTAKITVSGDRASIELGGSGVPMPFRNVDGRWRIDYGTLLGTAGAAK